MNVVASKTRQEAKSAKCAAVKFLYIHIQGSLLFPVLNNKAPTGTVNGVRTASCADDYGEVDATRWIPYIYRFHPCFLGHQLGSNSHVKVDSPAQQDGNAWP